MATIDGGDLAELEAYVGGMLKSLHPAERRKLLRKVATTMRRENRERIKAQKNTDGSAFAPRRNKPEEFLREEEKGKGKRTTIKDRAMFRRLRIAKFLEARTTDYEAWIGYSNEVARVAKIHQFGLKDRPSHFRPAVRYARRELLGMTAQDRENLLDAVIAHMTDGI